MNHITITKLSDLQEVINDSLNFSEPSEFPNMWALTFDDDLVKTINLSHLNHFLSELLHNRQRQLDTILKAKFYLWVDEQALQLRFNILFDIHSPLPFGCKLHIVPTASEILEEFLTCVYKIDEDGHDDTIDYVLSVYVEMLISKTDCFLKERFPLFQKRSLK